MALIKGAWESTLADRAKFYSFVVMFVIAYTLDLLVPWTIGYTIAIFAQSGVTDESFQRALFWIGIYTLLRLCYAILHHTARYLQTTVSYSAKMGTLVRLFSNLMRFPLKWHITRHSGETLSKLNRSAGAIDSVIGTYIWQIIEGLVKVVFAGIALFALDLRVALNVLFLAFCTIFLMIFFNRKLTGIFRENNRFWNTINRISVDYLVNIVTVKTLGFERSAERSLSNESDRGLALAKRISMYMELKWGMIGIGYAVVIGSSLVIYFIGHKESVEKFDVAAVYVLLNYLDRIFQAIGSFTGYYSGLIESATAYEDATEIEHEMEVSLPKPSTGSIDPNWKEFIIKELSFSYVSSERIGLREVDLQFKRGEKIALVGASGGGKSTLLKCLAGLLSPERYSIATDLQSNIPIEDVWDFSLLIPQEPEIFSETVKYNLTMGEDLDPKELSFFLSLCRLDLLMAKLPLGWDTSLVEKGLNLSVGEKQRVALARGLLRASRKSLLLLDEPTSSIDPKTEKEIFHGLLYHFADRTVITACHRLNLVPLFDRIVLMSQGAVLESGSFTELLEKKGQFYRAWDDYQSKAGKENS